MSNPDKIIDHLDAALEAILAAQASLGALPLEPPDEALDAALRASSEHQAVRAKFRRAWDELSELLPLEARQQALRMEEAANALAVSSATVGWRLGLRRHPAE